MHPCPRCSRPLHKALTIYGCVYGCPSCRGRMAALPVLRHAGADVPLLRQIRADSLRRPKGTLRCPHCGEAMVPVTVDVAGAPMPLDACRRCASVWFDQQEYEALPRKSPQPRPADLSPRAREALALVRVQSVGERSDDGITELAGEGSPPEPWQWVPGLLGLPVEWEAPRPRNAPWASWAFGGAFVIAFLMTWQRLDVGIAELGFIPARWSRHAGTTLLTSFLLHAGIFHLLMNLYFFALFANNVEDDLGHAGFVALLLGGAVAGNLVQMLPATGADVPCVGASGGLAAIMAYYAVAFPWARLGLFMWCWYFWLWLSWFRVPVLPIVVLFIGLHVAAGLRATDAMANIPYLAPVGGAVLGVAVGTGVRLWRSRLLRRSLGG